MTRDRRWQQLHDYYVESFSLTEACCRLQREVNWEALRTMGWDWVGCMSFGAWVSDLSFEEERRDPGCKFLFPNILVIDGDEKLRGEIIWQGTLTAPAPKPHLTERHWIE